MTPTEYVRPTTIPEALKALQRGTALAGGTTLAPRARHFASLVDLQALGLETLTAGAGQVRLGAMLRLQQLVEAERGFLRRWPKPHAWRRGSTCATRPAWPGL